MLTISQLTAADKLSVNTSKRLEVRACYLSANSEAYKHSVIVRHQAKRSFVQVSAKRVSSFVVQPTRFFESTTLVSRFSPVSLYRVLTEMLRKAAASLAVKTYLSILLSP